MVLFVTWLSTNWVYTSASDRRPAFQKSLISMFAMKIRVRESRIAVNPVQSGT